MSKMYSLTQWQQRIKTNFSEMIVQASTIEEIEPDGWQPFPIGYSFQFPDVLKKYGPELLQISKYRELVFCAVSCHTDDRRRGHTHLTRQKFVTTLQKNNITNQRVDATQYFLSLPHYKFVVSPEGNGIDCHRHYEALMAGCIPILEKNPKTEEKYKGLPILYTTDYSEITESYLKTVYQRMKDQFYDFSKLFLSFYPKEMQVSIKTCGNYWMTKLRLQPYYPFHITVVTALIDKHRHVAPDSHDFELHRVSASLAYKELAKKNHQAYCDRHGYKYVCLEERLTSEEHHPTWQKPDLMLREFENGADYVFWNDGDSFFTNFQNKLEKFIYHGKDLVATGDCNDITNAGHYLFKNSEWSIAFLKKWVAFRQPLLPETLKLFQRCTTHLTECNGEIYLSDQPCFNLLLAGADPEKQSTWFSCFNQINFYAGNPHALHDSSFSPIQYENMERCYSVIDSKIKNHIQLVVQRELNSTPAIYQKGDFVIHFIGDKNVNEIKAILDEI